MTTDEGMDLIAGEHSSLFRFLCRFLRRFLGLLRSSLLCKTGNFFFLLWNLSLDNVPPSPTRQNWHVICSPRAATENTREHYKIHSKKPSFPSVNCFQNFNMRIKKTVFADVYQCTGDTYSLLCPSSLLPSSASPWLSLKEKRQMFKTPRICSVTLWHFEIYQFVLQCKQLGTSILTVPHCIDIKSTGRKIESGLEIDLSISTGSKKDVCVVVDKGPRSHRKRISILAMQTRRLGVCWFCQLWKFASGVNTALTRREQNVPALSPAGFFAAFAFAIVWRGRSDSERRPKVWMTSIDSKNTTKSTTNFLLKPLSISVATKWPSCVSINR